MGVLWVIVFAIALFYAAKGSYNGVRGAYRHRRDTWANAHPNANGAARRAAAIGNMAALAVYGGPALYHGWREGWRDGWGSGRQWAAAHRPAKPEPQPEPEPEPVATMTRPQPQPEQPTPDNVVRMRPRPVPAPEQTQSAATTNPKEQDMAVETATGGDVHTAEQHLAEADTIVKEYATDRDDAAADASRAREDLGRIEKWASSLRAAHAPSDQIAEVEKLIDPAKQRLAAAEQRQNAASTALALAQAVLERAGEDVQHMGLRTGSWYGN